MQTPELKVITGGRKEWGHLKQIQIRSREGVLQKETLRMDWIKVPGKSVKGKCVEDNLNYGGPSNKGLVRNTKMCRMIQLLSVRWWVRII